MVLGPRRIFYREKPYATQEMLLSQAPCIIRMNRAKVAVRNIEKAYL